MPTNPQDQDNAAAKGETRPTRVISDAKAMRAMAHPVRLALLEAIRTEGDITATQAAELLDDSPGNMSWHLQTLAKYGFIEEAGGGKGRSRPWRISSVTSRFTPADDDPSSRAAGQVLQMTMMERSYELMREWLSAEQSFDPKWLHAAFMTDSITYLTAEELTELGEQVAQLCFRFSDRIDKAQRPEGAMPIHFNSHAHPMVPRTSGT
jgi:predicted transcriptional regulator